MVTIANVAQQLLDENGVDSTVIHATSSTALTRVEYLIDNAIDGINLMAGQSIADLSGAAGSKSLTATENQLLSIKTLSALFIRAYIDKGPQVNLAALNVSALSSDPHYKVQMKLFLMSLNYLRGRSFTRT